MARTRNLKPGFFKNEQLAECQALARLLFAGLWCLADRNGYLEDRPMRIKAELLPFDDVDCHALLAELAEHDLVRRFSEGGKRFLHIPTFLLHQRPHAKEPAVFDPKGGAPAACARTENLNGKPGQVQAGGGESTQAAQLDGKPGKFPAAPRAEPGIGSDFVPLQPLQNGGQSAPYSLTPHSLLLTPSCAPPGAGDFEASPEGLANAWAFYCKRRRNRGPADKPEDMVGFFEELLRLGPLTGPQLLDAIKGERDKSEYPFEFKKRLCGAAGAGKGPAAPPGARRQEITDKFLRGEL